MWKTQHRPYYVAFAGLTLSGSKACEFLRRKPLGGMETVQVEFEKHAGLKFEAYASLMASGFFLYWRRQRGF